MRKDKLYTFIDEEKKKFLPLNYLLSERFFDETALQPHSWYGQKDAISLTHHNNKFETLFIEYNITMCVDSIHKFKIERLKI